MSVLAKAKLIVLRIEAGYTIRELSEKAKVPTATISRAENGKPLSVKSAKKLCQALNVEFNEVFQIVKNNVREKEKTNE